MSAPNLITIFTAKATDGASTAKIKTLPRPVNGDSDKERVTVQVDGTWTTGTTVKPRISLDGGTTFTNATKFKDDGTQVDIAVTADATFNLELASDVQVDLIISGVTGTPSINARALGNIVNA